MNVSADAHQLWIAGMACGKTAFKTNKSFNIVLELCGEAISPWSFPADGNKWRNPNHFSETLLHHASFQFSF